MAKQSFFAELKKRKVVQVAAIYGAVAWGLTEVVVTIVEQLFLPQWVATLSVIGFVVGFPVAMFLAWTFDLTTEGIRRTEVTSRRGTASIALSFALLVAGTAGLFWLIKPAMQQSGLDAEVSILPNSVAVMPFDNASRNPNDAYLSSGLSDELRDQLGRVPELRTAARSSSLAVRELGGDAMSSSAKLGVAHLVEGSLRRNGNVLRVSVELIDGASGLTVWTESFDRGPAEFLSLQQEIMENVVRELLPGSAPTLPAPATRSATANEALLLGRYYEQQVRATQEVDVPLLLKAIDHYRDAVELDSKSALAHSRLAGALIYLGDLDAAEAPIFRALQLDPNLSEVQHTLGQFYWARGLPEARTAFSRAVELDPDNADALESHAFARWMQGNDVGVADLYRRALEIDRHSLSRYGSLGEILGLEGRVDEVLGLVGRIQQRFDGADAYRMISRMVQLIGRVDAAIAWGIRARDIEPENEDHIEWLAELYVEIGDFETAKTLDPTPTVGVLYNMRLYEELIDEAEILMIEEPDDVVVRYLLAFAYNMTGQYELAVHVLGSTGLPDTILNDQARSGWDWYAYFILVNATFGFGDLDVARGLAQWFLDDPTHHDNPESSVESFKACCLAVLGRDAEALDKFEEMLGSPRLPYVPMLKDSLCFQKYSDEPRYQAVLEHFEERRLELRRRLPATLARFGVTL